MLSLNAVGKMYDLPLVNRDISKVLNVASFTEGNSYFDFDPKVDHIAAWTIGALVAGKILAKVGIFALIAKFLAPFWKFIVLAFAGMGAWFKKKLGRKKEASLQEYHSEQVAEGHQIADETHQAAEEGYQAAEEGHQTGGEGHQANGESSEG